MSILSDQPCLVAPKIVVSPEEAWLREFERWKAAVFTTWANHLSPLLQTKTAELIRSELDALQQALGEPIVVQLVVPPAVALPQTRDQGKPPVEEFEMPTALETFFEMFKGNLSTVAMVAGAVIIPVAGSLMNDLAAGTRAGIMAIGVLPIIIFAAVRSRIDRAKLLEKSRTKARERLAQDVVGNAKAELERFRPEAERYAMLYCSSAQNTVLAVVEPLVARNFDRRERETASELAKAHLHGENLTDSLTVLRAAKTALSQQLLVDLRRRQLELGQVSGRISSAGVRR